MEKKIKLGFIGSHVRMTLVREIIPAAFPEIQAEIYEDDRYDYCPEMEHHLREMKRRIDGAVFGGELQFKLYQDLFEPEIPCACVQKDSASLLNSFLALSWRKADVSRVSVDNYAPSTVSKVLLDAGITENQVKVLRRRNWKVGEKYYEELYQEHRKLYREGQVEGCITTLIFVHDRLAADGIPVIYSRPTTDNIIKTVAQLKRECMERTHMAEGDLAVLAVHVTPKEEIFYHPQGEYISSHEKLKAAEELYYFARNARAAVIQQSDEQFIILMNRTDLVNYSNGLENLPFLQMICDNCKCNVNIGLGFGYAPGEAKSNAGLALQKAMQKKGSCAYIVHNINSITGPVDLIKHNKIGQGPEEQEILRDLAERTGISALKLYRIDSLMKRTEKSLFTATELAEQLNLSVRGASRLLNTLEEHKLACLVGQAISGKAGRPGNIYRILFDLE